MFSVSPEIYSVLSAGSRWLFAFFAVMLFIFALSWHRSERRERTERFKKLPGAGTIGELTVLSGSDELAPGMWFPVPREGVLGSLRSCDLVIPCKGVSSQHLDFSWQDGTGLLIRPRIGCEALIDGVPVTRRVAAQDRPLLHGSVLQVGSAVLRLQLFSALSHTNRTFIPAAPYSEQDTGMYPPAAVPPVQQYPPAAVPPLSSQAPVIQPVPQEQEGMQQLAPSVQPLPQLPQQIPPRPRRSRTDRWKEDWGE